MGRKASQQATFTKGVLDPDLSERIDLEAYYDSLAEAPNTLFHPQGGFSDRGGFELNSDADVLASGVARRLRRRIVPLPLAAGNITAANGGTVANLVDQSKTTIFQTNAVTGSTFTVFEVDLGAATQVDFVDLYNFKSELLGADEAIAVQYWTGSAWVTFGDALDVPTAKNIRLSATTRRFGTSPGGPAGVPVSARQWRVVMLDCVGVGRVSVGQLMMWQETTGLSPVRAREVARDDYNAYVLVITERNVDIFQRRRYVASVPLPVSADQVPQLGMTGGFDTLLIFHEALESQRIERQGSSGEWDLSAVPFSNVPLLAAHNLGPIFGGSNTSLVTVDTGSIVWAVVTGQTPVIGSTMRATSAASLEWMEGTVLSWNPTGGVLTLAVNLSSASSGVAHTDWSVHPITVVPSSAVFSGDQDEIQDLDLGALAAGQTVAIFIGASYAGRLTFSTLAAAATSIVTLLGTVPGIASGAGDIIAEARGASTLRIRFAATNGNRFWPLVSAIPIAVPAVQPTTAVVQEGQWAAGRYFSARTGWPRCGMLIQQRLMLAGFRAAPTSYAFSRNPSIYDFMNTGSPLTADLGFVASLDVDDVEIIFDVYVGLHLQVFTKTREFWAAVPVLSATQPLRFIPSTSNGIKRGVPLLTADGATLFPQAGGQTLREFRYSEAAQTYEGEPLSVLCPHIVQDIVGAASRMARRVSDGHLVLLVNADGSMAVITALKKQSVVAGSPWTTDGAFRSAVSGVDFGITAVTERDGDLWLETWTPDMPLDFATRAVGSPRSVATGLDYLEGRDDVWVYADGELLGPLTVTGGEIELGITASDITAGLEPEWRVRGNVTREKLQAAQPFRSPGRIYEVELALKSTGAIRLGTSGGPHAEVPLTYLGSGMAHAGPLAVPDGGAPQLPMMQRLFTGSVVAQGLIGVARHPYIELSRSAPVPVTVKAIRWEVSDKGD